LWQTDREPLNRLLELALQHSPPGSRIVAETEKSYDPAGLIPGDWDHRLYGGTRLSFISPPMVCGLTME
ncbi:MAG: SAM-dependent methyltransferase, partial [Planctomycetota bacterium]